MSTRTLLEPLNVRNIYRDCRYLGKDESRRLTVLGILGSSEHSFDELMIEKYRDEIASMVSQLAGRFKTATGASFCDTDLDNHDDKWSPSESAQEQLVQLGIAIGMIEIVEPRHIWRWLPKGQPTIRLKL